MQLQSLTLQNFRNYQKRTVTFSKNTTVFVGENAIGKTNILEAIFALAIGKCFRARADAEAIKTGSELARVIGKMTNGNETTTLEIMLTTGVVLGQKSPHKRYLVNGVSRRSLDFAGNLMAVLFEPEDIELVHGSPSTKRNYLDFILIQVDREYRRSLAAYEKGVRQRNRLLESIRDEGESETQLYFWDQLIIKNGQYLTVARQQLIEFINTFQIHFGKFRLEYDHSYISEERLAAYHLAEIASATTLVGPHRDTFEIFEGSRNLASFGSRGEQRLGVLWLKLAELEFMQNKKNMRPILLLDDIFSELDHEHRQEVLAIIPKQQTILTTTDIHFLPKEMSKEVEIIELGRGLKIA
jgi:DNA replication and repair protein RecF